MNVKDTLWKCLLNFPTIFPNALAVYDHWFCVCGNGYEWKDGELVLPEYDDDTHKKHNAKTINEAISNHLQYYLIDEWKDGGLSKNFLHCFSGDDNDIAKYVRGENNKVITYIKMIMDTENRMNDFSIPVDQLFNKLMKNHQFKFYPLSNYSKIFTFPDDVTSDWLRAIKQMVDLMEENKEILEDPDNLFPGIKERVYKLYNDRYNKCEYLGDIYEIIGMDTEECGAGCHSFDIDVYVCRRIKDGYTRTFEHVDRLI